MAGEDDSGIQGGPIAYMARNGVAANLLMWAIVASGLLSVGGIVMQAWPTLPFNHLEISVAYPGASPEEVEESIVVKIEEQVKALKDVKSVKSVAAPGVASVRVELESGTDVGRALDDIKAAVDRVQSFPAGAERPTFTEMTNRRSVLRLVLYGDVSERALKELAYEVEDRLEALRGVSEVNTAGMRDYEISIEVPLQRLRALGLTLEDVANAVRRDSLDLSAGKIETAEAQVRVRTQGQRYSQQDFEDAVVLAGADGRVVRVRDIARVRDAFEDADLIVRHEGQPAVFIEVFRADREKVAEVAAATRSYLDEELVPSLPDGVRLTVWNDESELFDERLGILLKNGALGLMLVFTALALFLQIRLAVWVAVGLIVSGIGTLAVLLALDQPIHADALLAFVLAIGIVVDDAIVVSEHIHQERGRGLSGHAAAVSGARRIRTPLVFAVLTSVAAFSPLLFLPGGIGEIIFPTAVVLISMLVISLGESLLVLPNHLSHLPGPEWVPTRSADRFLWRVQSRVDDLLQKFVEGPLDRWLYFATKQPAVVVAGALGVLVVSVSLIPAGVVPTTFADRVQGDFVTVSLEMPNGTPAQRTYEVAKEVEAAGRRAIEGLSVGGGGDELPLLVGATLTVGKRARGEGGGLVPLPSLNPESNIAVIEFKLLSAEQRQIGTGEILQAWREELGILPYVRGISFAGEVIALGAPVEAVLAHPDPARLGPAAESVMGSLQGLEGVFDIRSDHAAGVREVELKLRANGEALGLKVEDLARQVRAAFFGTEALRVQRGREEVRVYVRLPEEDRDSIADIENYRIRTPAGAEVPLEQIADLRLGLSAPSIKRKDGLRIATVTADVDPTVISGAEANGFLAATTLADLADADADLSYTFGGEAQQQFESFDALIRGFGLVMFAIFGLLAMSLRSYGKPLIVMAVIPFGLIGVVWGHLVLGVTFSFVSAMGFVGLSGVVVNDSLVMLDFIDEKLQGEGSVRTAIVEGAKGRFRPIMLTSVTTFLGFTPLIFEQSVHGRFLVPFAASLGFGILVTTGVLMLLVPALTATYLRVNSQRATVRLAGEAG